MGLILKKLFSKNFLSATTMISWAFIFSLFSSPALAGSNQVKRTYECLPLEHQQNDGALLRGLVLQLNLETQQYLITGLLTPIYLERPTPNKVESLVGLIVGLNRDKFPEEQTLESPLQRLRQARSRAREDWARSTYEKESPNANTPFLEDAMPLEAKVFMAAPDSLAKAPTVLQTDIFKIAPEGPSWFLLPMDVYEHDLKSFQGQFFARSIWPGAVQVPGDTSTENAFDHRKDVFDIYCLRISDDPNDLMDIFASYVNERETAFSNWTTPPTVFHNDEAPSSGQIITALQTLRTLYFEGPAEDNRSTETEDGSLEPKPLSQVASLGSAAGLLALIFKALPYGRVSKAFKKFIFRNKKNNLAAGTAIGLTSAQTLLAASTLGKDLSHYVHPSVDLRKLYVQLESDPDFRKALGRALRHGFQQLCSSSDFKENPLRRAYCRSSPK